mgnify:CR=1 FL=1
MCGIVAAVSDRNIVPILIEGLRRLEYRGYDSAGVVVLSDGELQTLKAEGKLRPKEFEVVSNKMGWTRTDARGLPPPPNNDELEKKVKAAAGK